MRSKWRVNPCSVRKIVLEKTPTQRQSRGVGRVAKPQYFSAIKFHNASWVAFLVFFRRFDYFGPPVTWASPCSLSACSGAILRPTFPFFCVVLPRRRNRNEWRSEGHQQKKTIPSGLKSRNGHRLGTLEHPASCMMSIQAGRH